MPSVHFTGTASVTATLGEIGLDAGGSLPSAIRLANINVEFEAGAGNAVYQIVFRDNSSVSTGFSRRIALTSGGVVNSDLYWPNDNTAPVVGNVDDTVVVAITKLSGTDATGIRGVVGYRISP